MKSTLVDHLILGRREALVGLAGASMLAVTGCASAKAPLNAPSSSEKIDFANPYDNIFAFGKIWGGFDKPQYGAYHGTMYARIPGHKHQPLFGYTGTGVMESRVEPNGHVSIRGKETGFFTDLATGDILEEWYNPYTEEWVKPFNFINTVGTTLTTEIPRFAFGGATDVPTIMNDGMNTVTSKDPNAVIPFILPFESYGDDLLLGWDYAHGYKNPVTKDKWPKAHTGDYISPSEHFTFRMSKAALVDKSVPSIRFVAGFTRVADWWPWMLMGGNKYQNGTLFGRMVSHKGLDGYQDIPPKVLAYIEKHHPESLEVQKDWSHHRPAGTWEKYASDVPPEV